MQLEGTHRVQTHALLLLALTLTFDLSTSKPYNLYDIPKSFPTPSLNTLGLFAYLSYAADNCVKKLTVLP